MIGFSGGANGSVEFNLNNGTIETPSNGTFSNEKIEVIMVMVGIGVVLK